MLVLVIEDNRTLAANIIEYLESHNFECDYASNGHLGLQLAKKHSFNAIILDIMLPGKDGMTLCKSLRDAGVKTPVIMLTARDTLEDKLQGFTAGADDYLIKPFALAELLARVEVLIKRTANVNVALTFADLSMNIDLRTVSRAGHVIELNKVSWQILEALLKASPKVITRQDIEQIIWQDQLPDSDALKSHIYKLRQLVDKPFEQALIQTVRGVGLILKGDNSAA
ncbi:response regulator transcription factor [Colwellia psychrerythraea]|uniref:Two component transcriptional regulator, winged helix family n=1 Tax=Colwellia psychrerythraea TaxID=28229 RepID=A0A099KQ16_COLPS|nr:response regulator transcription factor [Colwellia psychrerythraea]KGJ92864.1 two component transcriptional regulator, winged helix family [Colwellia psychrerythraea]